MLRFLSAKQGKRRSFYVDASAGNNTNTGRSPSQAWQTIAKVNSATFRAGDRILFKRGETWIGTCLNVTWDGVTIGVYGSGARPILDGNDVVNCIYAIGRSGVRLVGLRCTRGLDHGAKFDGCTDVGVVDCEMDHAGNDCLIFINNCARCTVLGGEYHDGYCRVVGYLVTGIEIADGGSDFVVDGAELYGSVHVGISVHNHNALDAQGATNLPTGVVLRNLYSHDNGTVGINVMNAEASTPITLTIEDCRSEANSQDGIRIAQTGQAIADGEFMSGTITLRRNSCKGNTRYPGYFTADGLRLERNVLQGGASYFNNCQGAHVYNNTFYNGTAACAALYFQGTRSSTHTWRNNIVQCDVVGQLIVVVQSGTTVTGWDVDRTLYRRTGGTPLLNHWHWLGTAMPFATWQSTSGGDANSPTPADAAFTNAAAGDLTLQVGSPAIDQGCAVEGVTEGYYGQAPDLGYAEKG